MRSLLLLPAVALFVACAGSNDVTAPTRSIQPTGSIQYGVGVPQPPAVCDYPPGPGAQVADFPPGPNKQVTDYPPGPGKQAAAYPPGPNVCAR